MDQSQENAGAETRKVVGRPFQKGNPGGPGRRKGGASKKPAHPPPFVPTLPAGETYDILADMQHAYHRPPTDDRTAGQQRCRKWLDDAPAAFMARLTELEKQKEGGGQTPPGAAPDLGTDRCIALIEQLLKEFNDAEFERR